MEIQAKELRLSIVWVEEFPCLVPPGAPMDFLGDFRTYGEEFQRIKSGVSRLTLPWPAPSGHHFWEYYLEKRSLDNVSAENARDYILPFRAPLLCKAALSGLVCRMNMEGYHYPHAIGIIINIVLQQDGTLNEMVEAAFNATNVWKYDVQWLDGTASECSLHAMALCGLDQLRVAGLGQRTHGEALLQMPLSVATVVEGEVDDPTLENPPNGEVHRALEALCDWHPLWKMNPLHPLDETTSYHFKRKEFVPAGHLLYGLKAGRAVWFPGYFPKTLGKKVRTLGCYHRNLVFATLQTAGLIALVRLGASWRKSGQVMSAEFEELLRKATVRLSLLYCAVKDKTYRSWSPYRQVKDADFLPVVNFMRDCWGWKKLGP